MTTTPVSASDGLAVAPTPRRSPSRLSRSVTDILASHRLRGAAIVLASLGVLSAASLSAGTAGASGILPPGNPAANIAPSSGDCLSAIDAASAVEGVGPMPLSEAAVSAPCPCPSSSSSCSTTSASTAASPPLPT